MLWKFTVHNIKKKTGLSGNLYGFSVNYETIDVSDIIDIHKYFMKKEEDIV